MVVFKVVVFRGFNTHYASVFATINLKKVYVIEYPLAWTNIPPMGIYPHLGFRD